jgi:hypothetical protein
MWPLPGWKNPSLRTTTDVRKEAGPCPRPSLWNREGAGSLVFSDCRPPGGYPGTSWPHKGRGNVVARVGLRPLPGRENPG